MAPPASATARRAPVRPAPRPAPSAPRRPPLRLFEPAPRRRPGARAVQRSTMWISGLLIVGSLLAVVVGDAFITQGQVRLSATERALARAEADQKTLQLAVAGKAAPPVVVSQAKRQGLVAASQVVSLPQVPLERAAAPSPHRSGDRRRHFVDDAAGQCHALQTGGPDPVAGRHDTDHRTGGRVLTHPRDHGDDRRGPPVSPSVLLGRRSAP